MNLNKEADKLSKDLYDLTLIKKLITLVDEFFEQDIDITDMEGALGSETRFIEIEQTLKALKERKVV